MMSLAGCPCASGRGCACSREPPNFGKSDFSHFIHFSILAVRRRHVSASPVSRSSSTRHHPLGRYTRRDMLRQGNGKRTWRAPASQSRTLELLLAHSRSCASPSCETCKMVPRVLASSPTGLSCHTGFSVKTQSRMSQRISEQLYEISCSSWHRGSRLPCAEVLVSPDFLSMFLAACGGVSALLPYAATCKAWRDAVDV